MSSFGLIRFASAHAPGEPPRKARVSYAKRRVDVFFLSLPIFETLSAVKYVVRASLCLFNHSFEARSPLTTLIFHPQMRAMHHGKDS